MIKPYILVFLLFLLLFNACNSETKNNTSVVKPVTKSEWLMLKRGNFIDNTSSNATREKLDTGLFPGCATYCIWILNHTSGKSVLIIISKRSELALIKREIVFHTNVLPLRIDSSEEINSNIIPISEWLKIEKHFDENLFWNLENYNGDLELGDEPEIVIEGSRDSTESTKSYNIFRISAASPGLNKLLYPFDTLFK